MCRVEIDQSKMQQNSLAYRLCLETDLFDNRFEMKIYDFTRVACLAAAQES